MRRLMTLLVFGLLALPALAQTRVDLGGIGTDGQAPVEVTAGSLAVDQTSGRATFSDDVLVKQGSIRLSAGSIDVRYNDDGDITLLVATGGITFATETDAAEAREARYDLTAQRLELSGDVLLAQGQVTIAADRMVINIANGSAELSGNVRTLFGSK